MKKLIPEVFKNIYRRIIFFSACIYHGVDLNELKFIGVSGTSGKTTTSSMLFHTLKNNGFKVGLISTVGVIAEDENVQTGFHVTTPDPLDLVKFLKIMIDKRMEYVVLESSSHALEQRRIGSIKYDYAVYTNITNDHLDWHKTWNNYARAKARLIDRLKPNGKVILNKDDVRSYEYLKQHARKNKKEFLTYSLDEITNRKETLEGVRFIYKNEEFNIKILGEYNISNAMAAIKVIESLGTSLSKISRSFEDFKTVQGRMEIFQLNPFTVILDFAHNGDSLEKSLQTAKKLVRKNGKLISIFGSAGLRDIHKRFEMGLISGKFADITIVTAEDPRTEKLFNINTEILSGVEKSGQVIVRRFLNHSQYLSYLEEIKHGEPQSFFRLGDNGSIQIKPVFIFDEESVGSRFDAIDFAMKIANEGDVVITNGKGHERSLAFGTTEYSFSDSEAIKKSLIKEESLNS